MNKLLEIVLTAVIYSPRKTDYFQRMSTSSLPTQAFLMEKIQQLTAPNEEETTLEGPEVQEQQAPATRKPDRDLQLEEQVGILVAENKALTNEKQTSQKALDAHRDRLLHVQENNEILREQLMEVEDKLLANETSRNNFGTDANSILRKLEIKVGEQEELISQYESNLTTLQAESDSQRRMIESFRLEREKAQKNQDLLDEAKIKIDDLTRKANTAEHFKQKLEASQGLEKSNRELRLDIERFQTRLRHAEEAKTQSQGAQMTIEQYKRTQERIELDHSQLQTVKRQLELDNDILHRKLESFTEQQIRDAEVISEQQERIRELEAGTPFSGQIGSSLEAELSANDKSISDLKTENAKLTGDLQRAKDFGDAGSENVMLKALVDDTQKKVDRLEKEFMDAQQSKLVLESEIAALVNGEATEGYDLIATNNPSTDNLRRSEVFLKLRETLLKHKEDLKRVTATLEKLELQSRNDSRELAEARLALSLVDKNKVTQIEEIKKSVSSELEELRDDHKLLQHRTDDVRANLETQRDLLNIALIEKDKLQKEMAGEKDRHHRDEISNTDLKATLEALEGRKEGARDVLEERIIHLQFKVEQSRDKNAKQTEHIKKQKALVQDLERRLQQAEENDQDATVQDKNRQIADEKNAAHQELANLQRETSLMATAWYNLSSRLQMPNVVVQRRSEAPKSWMNKQRQLLNGSMVRLPISSAADIFRRLGIFLKP
ncbi:MAG: hypothetical protein M1837_004617 [Sclerophora amabilis]|nr:MAG: hypothetical protein M1837_004617 [Sclerophora amabilis]